MTPNKFNSNTASESLKGIRGQILTFKADPFIESCENCYDYFEDGLIIVNDGKILEVGNYKDTLEKYPSLKNIDVYKDALILPGLIDCHVHYVQTPMIGSFGDTLLKWLNNYTFPTESKFIDKEFADDVAQMFFKQILEQGTTTANVFATTFANSVNAFFEESERYNTRMISGKVLQDRNVPDELKDSSAEESVALSAELMKKWHNNGRQLYAVIPRFAPTSTPEQLRFAGELYQANIDKGVYMHTHLDEVKSEIEWVAQLYPDQPTYTDVYRHFGLVGPRSIFAHCCVVKEEEWKILYDNDCGVAHCPSSNLFLGDGEFKYWEAKNSARPINLGVGTDVGGGTNFSVYRQLGEAYKVAMLKSRNLNAVRSLYLATRGGAEVLHLEDKIGSIAKGYEADLAVINLKPTGFAEWRLQFAETIFDKLFVLMTLGLNNLNIATYVAGQKVFDRGRSQQFKYVSELLPGD